MALSLTDHLSKAVGLLQSSSYVREPRSLARLRMPAVCVCVVRVVCGCVCGVCMCESVLVSAHYQHCEDIQTTIGIAPQEIKRCITAIKAYNLQELCYLNLNTASQYGTPINQHSPRNWRTPNHLPAKS